jgi:hypothetical protein
MNTNERVSKALEDLQDFLKSRNDVGWVNRTEYSIRQVKEGKIQLKTILDDFVGAGMGSLIDLYISSNNGHWLKQSEKEENAELMRLVEQLLSLKHAMNTI